MKYEWRKSEKTIYLPKAKPKLIHIPEYQFITLSGKGNPNNEFFSEYIGALYSVAYAIKMNMKKLEKKPNDYVDWTVYPLEGIWDIDENAKHNSSGELNKDNLIFTLMIRQPNFVSEDFFTEIVELTKKKKPNELLDSIKFEKIEDGKCVQMLHIGSYDDEPQSFKQMEDFTEELNLVRKTKLHREIYLSDFRKVEISKLKTVLRFRVKED